MSESLKPDESIKAPQGEEFLDAVRRHVCDLLGYDAVFIDIVHGHEVINLTFFASDPEKKNYFAESLTDEHQQPLVVAHTLLAQKVKHTQKPWVGHCFAVEDQARKFPYAVVPVIDGQPDGTGTTVGILRVVLLDESTSIGSEAIDKLAGFAKNFAGKLSQISFTFDAKDGSEAKLLVDRQRILLAHANRAVRRRFSRILSEHYQVFETDSAEKALTYLGENPVDLIILDGLIDGSSDNLLCKRLKETPEWKHVPIIVVAGDISSDIKVNWFQFGADDFLTESCLESELLAHVRTGLDNRRAERELAIQLELLEEYSQKLESAHEEASRARQISERDKQDLLRVKLELEQRKLEAEKRLGQDQLLHRISNIIRRSFNVKENISEALEALADYYNLDCCFVVMPSDEPEDNLRAEFARHEDYKLEPRNLDLAILESFKDTFSYDAAVFVSDVQRERLAEPFMRGPLAGYHLRALFYVPVTYEEKLLGLIGGHKCESEAHWSADNVSFFRQVADQVASGVTNSRLYACVQRQATTDGLTSLFNHRAAQERLTEQLRLAERYGRNLSVIMIDIDFFKSINDKYGHQGGDAVLKSVGRTIRSDCRDVDIPARYGGEEFLIVLPEVNQEGALVLAERIRRSLSREPVKHEENEIAITASFGVASYPEDAKAQHELLELADRALYMSKRLGRNQVHTASDLAFGQYVGAEAETPPQPVAPERANFAPEPVPATPDQAQAISQSAQEPESMLHDYPDQSAKPASEQVLPPTAGTPAPETVAEKRQPSISDSPQAVDMVRTLAQKLYAKSEYDKKHHLESARFAELLAKVLGLSPTQIDEIRVATLLHDVGLLSIPEEVLNKPGPVSAEEMETIKRHPLMGAQLLRPVKELKEVCDILEGHHEHWDGTGYPRGLKGESIPLASRIVSIVDAYHALISERPYRKAYSEEEAVKVLRRCAGSQFDPFLVDMFVAVLQSLAEQKADA